MHRAFFVLAALILLQLGMAGDARAQALPLSFGVEAQGEILDALQEDAWAFDAPYGQYVYLQRTASSNTNGLNWWIEDRAGRVIAENRTSLGDLGPVALMGGRYVIRVVSESGGVGTYAFIVHATARRSFTTTPGATLEGEIATPGEVHEYTFTAADGEALYVDTLATSNNAGLNYELLRGAGDSHDDVLVARTTSLNDLPRRTLARGRHTLRVLSENGGVGTYRFRLANPIDTQTSIAIEDVIDVSIDVPGQEHHYSFVATEGRRVVLDVISASSATALNWRLRDAGGRTYLAWTTSVADVGPFTLSAGEHTLSVRAENDATPTMRFAVREVEDPAPIPSAIGDTLAGEIDIPGKVLRYSFSAAPGQRLYIRRGSSTLTGSYELIDEMGLPVIPRATNLNSRGPYALTGGDYQLIVSGNNLAVGTFSLELLDVSDGTTAIALNEVVSGALSGPGQQQRYTFHAAPGQRVTLDQQATSAYGTLNWWLEDAYGRRVLARTTDLRDLGPVQLMGGEYTIVILGEGDATGTYTFQLVDEGVHTYTPSGTAAALDVQIAGTTTANVTDAYTVDVPEGALVYADLQRGAGSLQWTLRDPQGQPVFGPQTASNAISHDVGTMRLRGGTYTIELRHSQEIDYELTLRTVTTEGPTPLVLGAVIDGSAPLGGSHLYELVLPTDTSLFFDVLAGSSRARWTLRDEVGRALFDNARMQNTSADDRGPLHLRAGTYSLELFSELGYASTWSFQVHEVPGTPVAQIALEEEVDSSIDIPGAILRYELTVPRETMLYFHIAVGHTALDWRVLDEVGAPVFGWARMRNTSDNQGPWLLPAGTYTVEVDGRDQGTGAFRFIVHEGSENVATAELDELLEISFSSRGDIEHRELLLDEDTRVYFDVVGASGQVRATLMDAFGRVLFQDLALSSDRTSDRGPYWLPAGSYRLSLAPQNGNRPTVRVALRHAPIVDGGELSLEQTYLVTLPAPGSVLEYTFAPERDGQRITFDLQTDGANRLWSAHDEVRAPLFLNAAANRSGTQDRGPFPLVRGEYSLTIDHNADELGPLGFRLRDASGVGSLPPGCAACRALDIVFVFDTSGSMANENQAVCDLANDLVAALHGAGIPVRATYYGISDRNLIPCVDDTVVDALGVIVPEAPVPELETLSACTGGGDGNEDWANASAVVAANFPWQPDAVRLVVPVSDEGPYCGNPLNDLDLLAVEHAASVARAHDVVVSPIVPSRVVDPLIMHAEILSDGTQGYTTATSFTHEELLEVVDRVSQGACSTETEEVRPLLVENSPSSGAVVPAGSTLVLSGRVVPVNHLRPVLNIHVNGVPVDSLDASGRFFHVVEIEEGENLFVIDAIEECGAFDTEVVLMGAAGAASEVEQLADVTLEIHTLLSSTAWDDEDQSLVFDVRARNEGSDPIDGPLLFVVGSDLPAGVTLKNAAGTTPAGERWAVVVGEGEVLAPGAESAPVPLAFEDESFERVLFTPRWLAPENRPPQFLTTPPTDALIGAPYTYMARALDPDGQPVSYELSVGPAGMTLDALTGQLSWAPAASDEGFHDVALVAHDGRGGRALQRFTLRVADGTLNHPPVLSSSPVTRVAVGADYLYAATATDADGDTLIWSLPVAPAGMSVDPSGHVSWAFAAPGQYDVTLRVEDGNGGVAQQSWVLTVGEASMNPGAPIITSVPPQVAAVRAYYSYQVIAHDPDGDPLFYSLDLAPSGMVLDGAGLLTFTPDATQLGEHPVVVSVSDGRGAVTQQRWVLTVMSEPPDLPPLFESSPPAFAVVGQSYGYLPSAYDPENDTMSFTLGAGPVNATVDPVTGLLAWLPTEADVGEVAFALVVTDAAGGTSNQAWIVTVRESNAAPVFTTTPPTEADEGTPWRYHAQARDDDGDVLRYTLANGPAGMRLNPSTGMLSWTPPVGAGSVPVSLQVSDCCGGTDTQSFTIVVRADTTPPAVRVFPAQEPACLDEGMRVCVSASDPGGVVSRTLTVAGAELPLDHESCATVVPSEVGLLSLLGNAWDAAGNEGSDIWELRVIDCGDEERPVVIPHSPEPGALITAPTEIVVDIDDNQPAALTWTVSIARFGSDDFKVLAEGSGPVSNAAVATFDPTVLPNDSYRLRILASDGLQTGGVEYLVGVGGGLKLGNFRTTVTDLAVRVGGIPLSLSRTYDSLDDSVGDFGASWRMSLSGAVSDSATEIPGDDLVALLGDEPYTRTTRVYVTKPNGERVGFTFEPVAEGFPTSFNVTAHFRPDPGVEDKLEAVGTQRLMDYGGRFFDFLIPYNPDEFVLTTKEGIRYTLHEEHGLTHVEDRFGNTLEITPEGVISSLGLSLHFERDAAGRITKVTGPDDPEDPNAPLELRYAYDAAGNLIRVTDGGGRESRYAYEDPARPHFLTRIEDGAGRPIIRTVYDDEGRLSATCGPEGDPLTLAGCQTMEHEALDRMSTFVSAGGRRVDSFYDERGNLLVERRFRKDGTWLDTTWTYDDDGNVLTVRDASGAVYAYTYDERGRQTSVRDPSGAVWTQRYESCEEPVERCDPLGDCLHIEYDERCNPVRVIDPLGGVRTLTWTPRGEMHTLTDELGAVWTHTYDSAGRLSSRTNPHGGITRWSYDALGQLVSRTDANGVVRTFTYDGSQRVSSETWSTAPDAPIVWTYDAGGLITRVSAGDSVVNLEYWPDGRMKREDNTGSASAPPLSLVYGFEEEGVLRPGYDLDGKRTALSDSKGGLSTWTWDALGRLVSAAQGGAGAVDKRVDLGWGDDELLRSLARYRDLAGTVGVSTTSFEYDCGGCPHRLSAIRHDSGAGVALHHIDIERDRLANVTRVSDAEGVHDYAYDGLRRLLSATHTGAPQLDESYAYDAAGNRTSSHLSASYSYQTASGVTHRLVEDEGATYEYDAVGNLILQVSKTSGDELHFAYDAHQRLVNVRFVDGATSEESVRLEQTWDPFGRLRSATVDGVRTWFFYVDDNPVLLLNDAGDVIARRLYGAGADEVLAEERGGITRWPLRDHVGSVRDVIDDNGVTLAHYAYDSFGQLVDASAPPASHELLFAARPFDGVTGLGHWRARSYDPGSGRFLQPDPQLPWRYTYARNSPQLYDDPTGEVVALTYIVLAIDNLCTFFSVWSTSQAVKQLWDGVADAVVHEKPVDGQQLAFNVAMSLTAQPNWCGYSPLSP